ncbi:MAG: hypothetical protein IKR74_01540 [Bacilli bacterium]|nr:hypothetical protein [Bacilli bacterium]
MLKKDIKFIERIITNINELVILTSGKDDEYFYNSYEMVILCKLVDEVDLSLSSISDKLKNQYKNVKWDLVDKLKDNRDESLTVGKVWILSSYLLKDKLYNDLKKILTFELPIYYKKYCDKKAKYK